MYFTLSQVQMLSHGGCSFGGFSSFTHISDSRRVSLFEDVNRSVVFYRGTITTNLITIENRPSQKRVDGPTSVLEYSGADCSIRSQWGWSGGLRV